MLRRVVFENYFCCTSDNMILSLENKPRDFQADMNSSKTDAFVFTMRMTVFGSMVHRLTLQPMHRLTPVAAAASLAVAPRSNLATRRHPPVPF